ncbi:helix-turn-helix domain-containing protein [Streptomyces sp. NPDC093094]|uniref:helix-turn-helix domain-containing protein n=1 Tax=Streptomyces sp. NPDC093094 TaxID=3366026 RepID=UPI00380060C0
MTHDCGGTGCPRTETNPWDDLRTEMKRIKETTSLSYAALAQRTHYSRSSWERFLNDKQVPTRVAVEQFAAAAHQDARPLLARYERCVALTWTGHGTPQPAVGAGPHGPVRTRTGRPGHLTRADLRAWALVSAAAAALGSLLTLAVVHPHCTGGRCASA